MVDFYKMATGKTLEELVRPEVRALRERGNVTREEWEVPMNNFERQHLLPVLQDAVFMEHFLYCCSQVGFGALEATYEWALSRELVPEARRRGLMAYKPADMPGERWLDGMREAKAMRAAHRKKMAAEGKGFFAGTTEVTERGVIRHIDARSVYPQEAFATPGPRLATVKLDGRNVPLDEQNRPILSGGQEHCPECAGEGGFDPDAIPGAPVVCVECGGTGIVSTVRAEMWRKKNAEGFAAALSSLCPGCGSLQGLLDDGTCRECPYVKSAGGEAK